MKFIPLPLDRKLTGKKKIEEGWADLVTEERAEVGGGGGTMWKLCERGDKLRDMEKGTMWKKENKRQIQKDSKRKKHKENSD